MWVSGSKDTQLQKMQDYVQLELDGFMRKLRIFIADADKHSRLGLEMLIDHEQGMKIVGIAVQAKDLPGQVAAAKPDVVLVDWQLIELSPTETIGTLRLIESRPHIIVLHTQRETGQESKNAGADFFVCKDQSPKDLLTELRKISADIHENSALR